MTTLAGSRSFSVLRLLVGAVLLVPAVIIFAVALWYPMVRTLWFSLQKANLVQPAQFVGIDNYRALFRDPLLGPAILRSLAVAGVRLLAVLTLPVLAGWLWARQSPWVRIPGRLLLTIPLALSSPVALGLLWRAAISRLPALRGFLPQTPATALPSYLLFEFATFLSLGGAFTALALTLAWRPQRPGRAVLAVLALAAIVAVASGLETFTPSYLYGGGPANATTTLALNTYRQAFMYFRMGNAAAQAVPLLVASLVLGLLFGLLSVGLNLRLAVVPFEGERSISWWRVVAGLIVVLLIVLPAAFLFLWGAGVTFFRLGSPARLLPSSPLGQAFSRLRLVPGLLNGTLAPLLAIALLQLPVSYMAGLSLGLLRPFGRWGSRLAFALLLASAFASPLALTIGLFDIVHRAEMINTLPALGVPLVAGAASFFIFYLYFAGRHEALERAQIEGQPALGAFFKVVFLPSLPMGILAGATSLLLAGQSIIWPLAVVNSRTLFPLSMQVLALQAAGPDPDAQTAAAWLLLACWGVALFVVWGLLQALLAERLELVAGEE